MNKLDAINQVLFMINEDYINSLDDMSPDAQSVDELIKHVVREVCLDDKIFNILPVELIPDSNKQITIGQTVLSIDPINSGGRYRIIGKRLYDIIDKTYSFDQKVYCDCKILQEFEDLEDVVQNYIVKIVALKKISVELGSEALMKTAQYDLELATDAYVDYNLQLDDCNMFNNETGLGIFNRYIDTIH